MASTEPFALKSPHVWLFFDDAMGKAIQGSQGALGPANFIFLFMYKPSRSSTVCPPMMPSVVYSFPRPLWESKCRRDTVAEILKAFWAFLGIASPDCNGFKNQSHFPG